MAKGKSKPIITVVDRTAEAVGRALGGVASTIESLRVQHPHPVEEAREALAAGQKAIAGVTSNAATGATAIIKKAKAIARRTRKAATRARPKGKQAVARVTRTARKAVKRAKKSVASGRKNVKRAARRLKR